MLLVVQLPNGWGVPYLDFSLNRFGWRFRRASESDHGQHPCRLHHAVQELAELRSQCVTHRVAPFSASIMRPWLGHPQGRTSRDPVTEASGANRRQARRSVEVTH